MDRKKISRRTFGKMVAGIAGATALPILPAVQSLTNITAFAASPTFRLYGPCLTYADTSSQIYTCLSDGGYNTLKIRTDFGLGGNWTATTINQVFSVLMQVGVSNLVVRTSPDKLDGSPTGIQNVITAIQPWYQNALNNNIAVFIELGNEPNLPATLGRPDYAHIYTSDIWNWRYDFFNTLMAARSVFPRARFISSALAPNSTDPIDPNEAHLTDWFSIGSDVMRQCEYIGFHCYAQNTFTSAPSANADPNTIGLMTQHFSDRPWFLTEYDIDLRSTSPYYNSTTNTVSPPPDYSNPSTALIAYQQRKGKEYADFALLGLGYNRDDGTYLLPNANVVGALYYHLNTATTTTGIGYQADDPQNTIYYSGDVAFKTEIGNTALRASSAGYYSNASSAMSYGWGWSPKPRGSDGWTHILSGWTNAGDNGTLSYTNADGDAVWFSFYGRYITRVYDMATNRGTANIYIDGVFKEPLNTDE